MMLRVPEADRLSLKGLSLLTLPENGAVSPETITIVARMIAIYYTDRPMPKDYDAQLVQIDDASHLKLVAWYFNIVTLLERIHLIPLDHDTVLEIQRAMLYKRYENVQDIDDSVYNVYISLCCKTLKTLQGGNKYGHNYLAHNQSTNCFVCSKSDKKSAPKKRMAKKKRTAELLEDPPSGDEDDEHVLPDVLDLDQVIASVVNKEPAAEENKYQRKDFHFIPCVRQPVLSINLMGFALQYGEHRFSRCTQCAGLFQQQHQFNKQCSECSTRETQHLITCCVCSTPIATEQSAKHILRVHCGLRDPSDAAFSPIVRGDSTTQFLYFCSRHYSAAQQKNKHMDKSELLKYVKKHCEWNKKLTL